MGPKLKCNKVLITDHARGRLRIRAPGLRVSQAQHHIQHAIARAQRRGVETDPGGAVRVKFWDDPGLWAVCYPLFEGGWAAATIKREGWTGDMEEQERYEEQENSNRYLSEEEYQSTQDVLISQASIIAMLPLEKFLYMISHAETVAPFTDPTLYQKVLYGQGADNLQLIKEIASAARRIKAAVERFKVQHEKRTGG